MARARKSSGTSRRASSAVDSDALAAYAKRGPECAFANVRMLGRVVGAFYDDALKPADLRASQLALLWAILACEPVDRKALERITRTDQTTLSRTVNHLHAAGLVVMEPAADRRSRIIRLSERGQRTFLRAMPYWERAQRELGAWLPVAQLARLAKAARALGDAQDAR